MRQVVPHPRRQEIPQGQRQRKSQGGLGKDLHALSAGQLTHDLRRLRVHGLITRRAGTHRYQVTDTGLHHAMFLTRARQRLLRTGLARLTDPVPSPLRSASRACQTAVDNLTRESGIAA